MPPLVDFNNTSLPHINPVFASNQYWSLSSLLVFVVATISVHVFPLLVVLAMKELKAAFFLPIARPVFSFQKYIPFKTPATGGAYCLNQFNPPFVVFLI